MKHCISASRWRVFALSSALALLSAPVLATDPPWLERLPSVDVVLANHQGADREDTLARQEAALNQLAQAVGLVAGGSLTLDEQRTRGEYLSAARKIHKEALASLSKENPDASRNPWAKSPRDQWRAKQAAYERDPEFRAATFERYIPAEVRPQLDAEYAEYEARFYGVFDKLTPEARPGALLFLGGLLLLSLLIVVRELRPFGSKASNPLLVSAGFRLYRLHWYTGTVTAYESWTETVKTTTIDEDPYGNTRRTFTQRTYFHERFTLMSASGGRLVHVTDAHVGPTIGHIYTAV